MLSRAPAPMKVQGLGSPYFHFALLFYVISTEANEVSEVEKSNPYNKARFLDTLFYVYSTQNNGSK